MNPKNRATLIINSHQGFIFVENTKGQLLLPGGEIEKGELPINAAIRELHEETNLEAEHIQFFTHHTSTYYLHYVYLIHSYSGNLRAGSDAKRILHIDKSTLIEKPIKKLTNSNREIIKKYLQT